MRDVAAQVQELGSSRSIMLRPSCWIGDPDQRRQR